MGRRVPEPDAAEAGGLRPDPRRGLGAARQGAQRAGAGRHWCSFFFLVILCYANSLCFVFLYCMGFCGFQMLVVFAGF
jgi:hypothetical protein